MNWTSLRLSQETRLDYTQLIELLWNYGKVFSAWYFIINVAPFYVQYKGYVVT